MKLFYSPGACSLSPHIVLREIGLDFTLEKVDLAQKKTELGTNYLTINPKGKVPALLLDDGSLLTEGVAIVQYLADQLPSCNLIPPLDSLLRYHTIEWLSYISTELHKGFSPLFNPKTPEEYKIIVRENLDKQFNYLDTALKENQYLQNDHFSVADAYLFTILRWAVAMKFDIHQKKYLGAYFDRVAMRPAVDAALIEEGLKK
ncbi:glutathione S-transferase domain [Candidatus Rickettsiella viridis]|uniref:Glutathione S-transferase domain n=1 Tax=Candidatus Rickettsiella viridis TaxID=676208 RepID=A0A2Z5UUD0_9COXI|nr:glutathione transferase GstA [Candidatus Rickettsiella viridis]BBB15256.1 glutathione S-transferase domain [Candidatus Rickettsiella viridis]